MGTELRTLMNARVNKTRDLIETTNHEVAELRGVIQSAQETIAQSQRILSRVELQRRAMASSVSIRGRGMVYRPGVSERGVL